MKKKIEEILRKYNEIYESFYNLKLQEINESFYIFDEFEEFYYGNQDFDNLLEDLTTDLRKVFNKENLYLECECAGRWQIAFI